MADITADMAGVALAQYMDNPSLAPCDWIMVIYGPAAAPHVVIGDNMVELTGSIPAGGHVTIDSRRKTIILTRSDGSTQNVFDWGVRGKGEGAGHYCFERIPAGTSQITWPNAFGFDLQLIEERSDPSWRV